MPANLPPQYYEAERRYREAKSIEEKISILQEMLAIMPKHKGTDKLQADLRAKISKLKKSVEKKKGPARKYQPYLIKKEGAAQVILAGPPNTGKSSILAALTKASPEIAPYPFTTHEPKVGMMPYENIKIQLVDTPPICPEVNFPWMGEVIRRGDLVAVILDAGGDDILEQVEMVLERLREFKIRVDEERPSEEKEQEKSLFYSKIALVANKDDLPGAEERISILKEFYKERFPVIPLCTTSAFKLDNFKREIYRCLGIIRVYTKAPGKQPDMEDPVVLKKGSLVIDAARAIHKDFAKNLKYARIWGKNEFKGQKVEREHPLEEGDVLEFHI
ncbi:MAG TPA: TGS domain-containing protein [Candidatus Aerophobetes bacterium]|uniref:TGS domain-containing protein n=1 Tax=Aerophobetes bacterium TaxID=2030807 RepID=A0A7V5LZB5_UNCAE|nr:TGS domain-containing protein [Candidatus Aerophobetes bacterium]